MTVQFFCNTDFGISNAYPAFSAAENILHFFIYSPCNNNLELTTIFVFLIISQHYFV